MRENLEQWEAKFHTLVSRSKNPGPGSPKKSKWRKRNKPGVAENLRGTNICFGLSILITKNTKLNKWRFQ